VSSTPTGWLLCDGSAVSRTTYAALFTAISTTYGTGDGSTTFNVPDYRGRSPLGPDTGGVHMASAKPALGASGGEEKHTLTTSESGQKAVSTSTGVESAPHTHSAQYNTIFGAASGTTYNPVDAAAGTSISPFGNESASHSHSVSISGSSASSAHNVMHPYLASNCFVKQ